MKVALVVVGVVRLLAVAGRIFSHKSMQSFGHNSALFEAKDSAYTCYDSIKH